MFFLCYYPPNLGLLMFFLCYYPLNPGLKRGELQFGFWNGGARGCRPEGENMLGFVLLVKHL